MTLNLSLTHLIHSIHRIPRMYLDDAERVHFSPEDLADFLARHHLKGGEDQVLLLAQFL